MDNLVFYVNGNKIVEPRPDPYALLLDYLRRTLHLTGAKASCGQGRCGACTVMLSWMDMETHTIKHAAVMACLTPLCSLHDMAVTTAEGVSGDAAGGLHPVQERLVRYYGSQCGFCSPGVVMSMYALLRNTPVPSERDVTRAIAGNLCRCTGYRPILDALKTFTQDPPCALGAMCCKLQIKETESETPADERPTVLNDPTQEIIFPPELKLHLTSGHHLHKHYKTKMFGDGHVTWYRPASVKELMQLLAENEEVQVVAGGCSLGSSKLATKRPSVRIGISHLMELQCVNQSDTDITVGAGVSLAQLAEILEKHVGQIEVPCGRIMAGIKEAIETFGNQQIQNMTTVGGCLHHAAYDMSVALAAAGSSVDIQEKASVRSIPLDAEFFSEMSKAGSQVIIRSVVLRHSQKDEFFHFYKQTAAEGHASTVLNAGLRVVLGAAGKVTEAAIVVLGEPCTDTMALVQGRTWDEMLLEETCCSLSKEVGRRFGVENEYLGQLASGLFTKFFFKVQQDRNLPLPADVPMSSAFTPTNSVQVLTEADENQAITDPVGRLVPHESAYQHATGEAAYIDDIPVYSNELHLALVLTTIPHGRVLSVDWSRALEQEGVVGKVDHSDVPGTNRFGLIIKDQLVFVEDEVTSCGQVIGGVLGKSRVLAERAARLVTVQYDHLPSILNIDEAIASDSFFPGGLKELKQGDVDAALTEADGIVEGQMDIGGQEHYYMECFACIAKPGEKGSMDIFAPTQCLGSLHTDVSLTLDVPKHKLFLHVRRLGGAFGGKETQAPLVVLPAAVAARKAHAPVRCSVTRADDMRMTGGRGATRYIYQAGYTKSGQLIALAVTVYINQGHATDLGDSLLRYSMYHLFHSYNIPHLRVKGYMVRTHTRINTAFRGFGMNAPMLVMEDVMGRVARRVGAEQHTFRERHLYKEGDITLDNQKLMVLSLDICWQRVIQQSGYQQLVQQVDAFNRTHKLVKRGVAIAPSNIRVGLPEHFLNAGSALVHVYTDGSVLVSHGGVEMGQGLHTKVAQLVSRMLSVPLSDVHIDCSHTAAVPNPIGSFDSHSTDLYGKAAMMACDTLLARLGPIKARMPDKTWKEWVAAAFFERVNLSATGYYRVETTGYNEETNSGRAFMYDVQGAAVSLVEVDVLTGHHKLVKTDIVMDIGQSINPAIDVGQIEGGFMMGYGFYTMEEINYNKEGVLNTDYFIPTVKNIPTEFNVTLLKGGKRDPRALYSSKAVGEPPMGLSTSTFMAIKAAVGSARGDRGWDGDFRLDSPATARRICAACNQRQFL